MFTHRVRIVRAAVKAPLRVHQSMSVKSHRGSRYLLIDTTFLTNLGDKNAKCEKAAARRQQKRQQDGRKWLMEWLSFLREWSRWANNWLLQANDQLAVLCAEICKLKTDGATTNRTVPDHEWQDLVHRSKRRREKWPKADGVQKYKWRPGTTRRQEFVSLPSSLKPTPNYYACFNNSMSVTTVQRSSKPLSTASTISSMHNLPTPAQTTQRYNAEQLTVMNMTRPPCQTNIPHAHCHPTFIRFNQHQGGLAWV